VVGIYANFQTSSGSAKFGSGAITQPTGMSSDEIISTQANDPTSSLFYQLALSPDNSSVGSLWSNAYTNLYQMNVCLAGIRNTTAISDSLKRQLLGEISVTRALYYFNLVNLFGGMPLVTAIDYNINAVLPRSSVDSVYSLIQSDLAYARSVLSPAYPSAGHLRPNLYTALALSARVYLYRQQWDSAALMAGQVIASGIYQLEQDPNNVFLDGSNEAIWQLPATGTNSQTAEAAGFIPFYSPPGYSVTNFLLNAFEPGDLRRTDWIHSAAVYNYSTRTTITYTFPYKYKNRSSSASTTEDYMIFRLGEQYLILAEAQAHLNKLTDAVNNLNQVRTRASLSGTSASSQTDILAAVLHERQTELFCEWGHRWYDLKRTGAIANVMNTEKPGLWQPFAALYPVPKGEIQANPLLQQNTGY
jgi:starch-binding outer membrane protein, SusD/RagB family